jgi:hypothetical protein
VVQEAVIQLLMAQQEAAVVLVDTLQPVHSPWAHHLP